MIPPLKHPSLNKFHVGAADGRHYWLTPPQLYSELNSEFNFTFDPCPFPKPENFDGLTAEWGASNYVNPPFGSIIHEGRKKGMTAWVRKALAESAKGKSICWVFPLDKWVLMLLSAGAEIRNLGDVKWLSTEDGKPGKGTGRHIAAFILNPQKEKNKMLEKLERLIVELTALAVEARVYLVRESGMNPIVPEELSAPKMRKPRKAKEETPAPMNGTPVEAGMTEDESAIAVQTVAKAFVQRFNAATPSGIDQAREILKTSFKVAKLPDLVNAQRLEFVKILKEKLAAAA